jgi:hypothetical protein
MEKKNMQLLNKVFNAAKGYLFEDIYANKITCMIVQKKTIKLYKQIFHFLKVRTFERKRTRIKALNLVILRRCEFG